MSSLPRRGLIKIKSLTEEKERKRKTLPRESVLVCASAWLWVFLWERVGVGKRKVREIGIELLGVSESQRKVLVCD